MTFSRRNFLKTTGTAAVAALALPQMAQAARIKNIGIQLYTVRDVIEKDTKNVLARLAKAGYTQLEAYGIDRGTFFGTAAADFKKMAADLGMKTVGSHAMPNVEFGKNPKDGLDVVVPGWKKSVATANEAGLAYITFPFWLEQNRKTVDDFKKTAAILNLLGEYAARQGLKFTYHNHDFEFKAVDGVTFYDVLLNETDPKLVNFEMDLYWVVAAGKDPADYFAKHPGRFHQFHLKDMDKADRSKNTEVGKGSIDFAKILKMAPKAGTKHFFVEQENGYASDSLTSAALGAEFLKKLNY